MTRRAMFNGLIGGLTIITAAIYPALTVITPALIPAWMPPLPVNNVTHAALLMLSAIIGFMALIITPLLTIAQTQVSSFRTGYYVGSINGLIIGLVVAIHITAPLNNISGLQLLLPAMQPTLGEPTSSNIVSYALHVFNTGANVSLWTIGVAVILCGFLGGFTALARQKHLNEENAPSLYELVEKRKARDFFKANDEATNVGLVVGVLVGGLVWLAEVQNFYLGFARIWPELGEVLSKEMGNNFVSRAIPFPPIIIFALVVMGGVIVASIKNPTSRFGDRLTAVIVGFDMAFFIWFVQFMRNTAFYLGMSPFLLRATLNPPAENVPTFFYQLPTMLAQPEVQILLTFAAPWLFTPAIILISAMIGTLSGTFYGLLTPIFLPRPVDRAARLRRQIKREPQKLLPFIYFLFGKDPQAYEVLAYAARDLPRSQQTVAQVLAAYHTLGTHKPQQRQMSAVLSEIMKAHPEWRLAKEISSVMRSLNVIVTVDSLQGLQHVPEPLTSDTSSLPPMMVRAIARIREIFAELEKVMRVTDLASKLTFYNDALNAIRVAQNFVNNDMRDLKTSASVYPEQPLLSNALDRWEEMVQLDIKRLKGRADLIVELKSHQLTLGARVPITISVKNRGLNVAEHTRVRILSGEDYYVVQPAEKMIGIMGASEERELTMTVEPKPESKRLRLQWEVTFDDSIEAARQAEFADIAEFVSPDKPFQKIFPIPYVTGTPLKESSVFVGRQDIFDFVKENLLGTHQNNVIILHGQRRTGKTSVLYRLGEVLRNTHVAVLIDMQGKPARGEADFLYSIADDIVYALEREGIMVELPERKAFEEAPEFFFSSRFIRSLHEPLGTRNLLLLFDEFEELQRRVDDKKLAPEIFQFLRNLMQHEAKVDFIFAGTHKLEDLGSDYWSALFNIAVYKQITFLSHTEVRRLITEPVGQSSIEYDPLAMEKIAALTAGHPYFTQLLLHEIVVYHNETERSYITTTDVEEAVNRVMERGEAHFKYIWTESTDNEQFVMRLLAEGLVAKPELALSDLEQLSNSLCGCEFEVADAAALNKLAERDIVWRSGKLYRFTVPLIEKWVRHTHPLNER